MIKAPFDRPDLFVGSHRPAVGRPPHFHLRSGLSVTQQVIALQLVEAEYPALGYGTSLDPTNNVIRTYSAD